MANGKSAADQFGQIGYMDVECSAANTLTWKKLQVITGALLGSRQYGLIISRIEYWLGDTGITAMGPADNIEVAIAISQNLAAIDQQFPEILDSIRLHMKDVGAAGGMVPLLFPIVKDLSTLPGGGVLVPADRIFIGVGSNGLASVASAIVRFHYKTIELNDSLYLELLQSRTMLVT